VPGVRALVFQHAVRVLQQGRIEEADAQVMPERAEDGDVAPRVQVARVSPLDRFQQPDAEAQ